GQAQRGVARRRAGGPMRRGIEDRDLRRRARRGRSTRGHRAARPGRTRRRARGAPFGGQSARGRDGGRGGASRGMTAPGTIRRSAAALLVVTLGVTALVVARGRPDLSPAAHSSFAQVAFLIAGWLVVAAGMGKLSQAQRLPGALLMGASCAWFVAELTSPAAP